jgi:DNA end-binding protein Ku
MKQQNIDSETGEVVTREDTARGYEAAKGQYLIVEDQEIDAVQIESTRTIEIDQFVPRSEIGVRVRAHAREKSLENFLPMELNRSVQKNGTAI